MVNFCAVYGCSNRSNREKDRSYFRLPAIITRPNDEKQALSKERRATWLAKIYTIRFEFRNKRMTRTFDRVLLSPLGKVSAQPHTLLCIQSLLEENNSANNRLPLGLFALFSRG